MLSVVANHFRRSLFMLGIFVAACGTNGAYCKERSNCVESITADAHSIRLKLTEPVPDQITVLELEPYEAYDKTVVKRIAWQGSFSGKAIHLKRFVDGQDRLFRKFLVVDSRLGTVIDGPRYVDKILPTEQRPAVKWPRSKKGLQCIVDLDDAIALGVKHAGHNVSLPQLLDLSDSPAHTWKVDGEDVGINMAHIRSLDARFKRLSDAGITVSVIFLNYLPAVADPNNPLIHPATDVRRAPNHLGAFNLTNRRGLLLYRAALEFMAQRYGNLDGEHGRVSAYIIGNEIQAHWWWYNLGSMDAESVIREYALALRIAHLATQKYDPSSRVFTSFDHHWTATMVPDKRRFIAGRTIMERLNALIRREGDFAWHVAFHPYPENLFEPRSWLDKSPTFAFDTPKITFKNIEVLTEYMKQSHLRYQGKVRRVMLSEQGFHTPAGPDGERQQAASYVYAYLKTRDLDGIDAFILHRHTDHTHEGGLRLGLRENLAGTVASPGKAKLIYDVFRAIDTPEWNDAIEFAKPIIGVKSWDEIGNDNKIHPIPFPLQTP